MPHRTICQILEEVRKAHETSNYSYLPGLVEEIQSAANRMEAKLYEYSDYKWELKEIKKLEKRRKDLEEKIENLKNELDKN